MPVGDVYQQPQAICQSMQDLLQLLQNTTSPELQPTRTIWRSSCGQQTPHDSLNKSPATSKANISQPAGHGPVHTDENYAVIILRAKAEDNTNSIRELPCIRVGGFDEKDFQTSRNKAVKLLSNPKQDRGMRPSAPETTATRLLLSSSATSTFVPHTFQQPQQPAPGTREYILTIPETQMLASQVIQPTQPKDSSSNPEGSQLPS